MTLCLVAAAGNVPADPVARVALFLACVLVAAKLGGELAVRARQPAVLGELVAGIALGNVAFLGIVFLEAMKRDPVLDVLGGVGALILLFEVGLESTIGQMLRVMKARAWSKGVVEKDRCSIRRSSPTSQPKCV